MNLFQKIHGLLDRCQQREMLVLLGLMTIGALIETLSIGLIIPILTLIMEPDIVNYHSRLSSLLNYLNELTHAQIIALSMLLLIFVYTFKMVYLAFLTWMQARFTFEVTNVLSRKLFVCYLNQSYTFHLQRNSAQLIQSIFVEVQIFSNFIIVIANIFTEIFVFICIASLLIFFEPQGALIVLTCLSVISWGFYSLTKKRIFHWGELRQFHDGQRIQHLQQGFGGVKDLKLLGREDNFEIEYLQHTEGSTKATMKQTVMNAIPRLLMDWLAVLGMTGLVFSMLIQNRPINSIIPVVGLFAAATFRLVPSVNRILGNIQNFRYTVPVINTLFNELSTLQQLVIPTNKNNKPLTFTKDIVLNNIFYTYPDSDFSALSNINLSIPKGSSVGFIGGSGAGKSTLIDIIIGLLTPNKGYVLVDNTDTQANLRDWKNKIGYVPQSIYLTDDSLKRNVAFGLHEQEIDEEAVNSAIKAVKLHKFVNGLPDGLDTMVGERGVRLSGGQCQRIGIARALYHDPQLLVLDEATSALDVDTEKEIMRAVNALSGDKTIIIVTHRMTTVSECDFLYKLEKGCVVRETA